MTALPGLHRIDFDGSVNAYILETASGTLLVDTGLPGMADKLVAAIRDAGIGDVDLIVLTHVHVDHAGGLADTVAATGSRVAASALEADLLREGRTRRELTPADHCPEMLREMIKTSPRIPAREVDVILTPGETVPGFPELTVVAEPGHAAGMVGLLWDNGNGGVLVGGDIATNFGRLYYPPVAEDHDLAKETLRKIAALDFEAAVVGHGEPIGSGASAAFREAFAS